MIYRFKQFLNEIIINLPYHDTLNQKIFDDDVMKPKIREILLSAAEKFRIGCKVITPEMVSDIVMTGGNANYTYSDISDIDIHLITDLSSLSDLELAQNFFSDEKRLWTLDHEIKVAGYPIEMYVQDDSEKPPEGQGVYSLTTNTWLVKPSNLHLNLEDNPLLQKKVDHYSDLIVTAIKSKDIVTLKALKDKIKKMRDDGLTQGGEFSNNNLVFKALRNAGLLDKMTKVLNKAIDKTILKGK